MEFGSLDKMKITSSDPKDYLKRSGKGFIASLGIKTIGMSKKKKKESRAITNVSINDISKIINDFEKLSYEGYFHKRTKHVPTDSYFYLDHVYRLTAYRSEERYTCVIA